MKAIVVEDNAGIRAIVVELLERRGHAVEAFADAEAAWAALEPHPFDIAVLDWGLPGMDGLELCRRLRARPNGDLGAVVVLTGRAEPEDLDEVVASGANDYITKPFKLDQLETRIAFAERKVPVLVRRLSAIDERDQAAQTLRASAQLHRDRLLAAQRQADQLRLLDRVRAALSGELELARVFRIVVEATAEILGYRYTSLYLREGDELVLQHQVGYDDPSRIFYRFPVTEGISGTVASTGVPILLDDADRNARFLGALDDIRSEICVPLMDGDRVAGIFNVETKADHPLTDEDLRLLLGVAEHVSHAIGRARLYDEARASEQRLRLVLDSVQEVVFQADADGRWTFLNRAWEEITGFRVAESLGQPVAAFGLPEKQAAFAQAVRNLSDGTRPDIRGDFQLRTADGGWRWVEVHVTSAVEGEPPYAIIGTLVDITQRKEAEDALRRSEDRYRHLALHDSLTGLPNRALFAERLDAALLACADDDAAVAVLFLDLDGFKQVNDTWGHEIGDRLLVEVAGRLRDCVRAADTVARFGGDEFAIMLRTQPGSPIAQDVADRALAAFRAPFELGDRTVALATSIGIAQHAGPMGRTSHLLRNADAALYAAKASGRGVTARHEQPAHAAVRLAPPSVRNEPAPEAFDLQFAPIFDLATGDIVALDALAIPVLPEGHARASETGPLGPSERHDPPLDALLQALGGELARWETETDGPLPRVAIDLPGERFAAAMPPADFAARLAACGIAPESLALRLGPRILAGERPADRRALEHLRGLGIGITVAGLGTAPFSLAALAELALDGVTIDRALVAEIGRDKTAAAVVDGIGGLARALGLAVTAEGIATIDQLARVRAAGIPFGQGRYFARPLAGEGVTALILNGRGGSLATPLLAVGPVSRPGGRIPAA